MKTKKIMHRTLFDGEIRQDSLNGFLNASDLVKAGNKWRIMNDLPIFYFRKWIDSKSNKEFFKELKSEYGQDIIKATRGAKGETWLHPYIFVDLALAINPKLKIEVYKWLYDELIKYRHASGDSYIKMCGALALTSKPNSDFRKAIALTANKIKAACGVTDWEHATEEQLKLRDRIHNNITILSGVFRSSNDGSTNNQAVRIGIAEAIKK